MLEYAKDIDWLKLEKEDIIETIRYLEEMSKLEKPIEIDYPEYQVFSQNEMETIFNNCVEMLEEKIK